MVLMELVLIASVSLFWIVAFAASIFGLFLLIQRKSSATLLKKSHLSQLFFEERNNSLIVGQNEPRARKSLEGTFWYQAFLSVPKRQNSETRKRLGLKKCKIAIRGNVLIVICLKEDGKYGERKAILLADCDIMCGVQYTFSAHSVSIKHQNSHSLLEEKPIFAFLVDNVQEMREWVQELKAAAFSSSESTTPKTCQNQKDFEFFSTLVEEHENLLQRTNPTTVSSHSSEPVPITKVFQNDEASTLRKRGTAAKEGSVGAEIAQDNSTAGSERSEEPMFVDGSEAAVDHKSLGIREEDLCDERTHWANLILLRLFHAIHDEHWFINNLIYKLNIKLRSLPALLGPVTVTKLELGPQLPRLYNVRILNINSAGELEAVGDVAYRNGLKIWFNTEVSIKLPKFVRFITSKQEMCIPITLAIEVNELVGRLRLYVPPPPSDQVYIAFHGQPRLEISVRSVVGDQRRINNLAGVAGVLRDLVVSELVDRMAYPNMENYDNPFTKNFKEIGLLKDLHIKEGLDVIESLYLEPVAAVVAAGAQEAVEAQPTVESEAEEREHLAARTMPSYAAHRQATPLESAPTPRKAKGP
eukprot:GCRY01003641.1.p1 GENE.GCRY01003641.1~~GCRY01003641.1.p1  ORF type:complete len:585 (+),score=109.42 GCRY01003641.1:375-2129(+)